jgi:hypothetical protein
MREHDLGSLAGVMALRHILVAVLVLVHMLALGPVMLLVMSIPRPVVMMMMEMVVGVPRPVMVVGLVLMVAREWERNGILRGDSRRQILGGGARFWRRSRHHSMC